MNYLPTEKNDDASDDWRVKFIYIVKASEEKKIGKGCFFEVDTGMS